MVEKTSPIMKEKIRKDVVIEFWGGINTIGGNCIRIRDRDEAIILDQGLNFSVFKKYYGGFIQPEIVDDLREVGAIPPREVYENVSSIYITHSHIDHVGSLAIPYEYDVKVYVPSKHVLERLSGFWSKGWKGLLLPQDMDGSLADVNRTDKVVPIQVSHSAYPAYSYLVYTSEGTILYTGDFRIHSPIGKINTLKNYAEEIGDEKIDMLIIEGTNFSRRITPLQGIDVENMLERILDMYSHRCLFVSAHPLDVESFLLVASVLNKKGYVPVLTHTRYAELLDTQFKLLGINNMSFYLLPLRGKRMFSLIYIEEVMHRDIRDWKVAFFTSVSAINEIKMLKRKGMTLDGLLHVTLMGEPIEEEGWIMENIVGNWIRRFGMNSIRLHLSGHYYPHEYKDIISTVKPRKLIPIHTKAPRLMVELFNRYK